MVSAQVVDDLPSIQRWVAVLETVLDESMDPIFNVLEDGTYRYVNRAFSRAIGREPQEVIGQRVGDLFPPDEAEKRMAAVRDVFATGRPIVFDVRVPTPDGDTFYMTSVKPIPDRTGKVLSAVCIAKNITERKRVEKEREDLIQSLQSALQQVRILSGMLPICAYCKKVRDDDGYWTQLEGYIRDHSMAEFTHGICPDCKKAFFPESR